MERISIVKFHHIDKLILNSVICKLHISKECLFEFRVNLVNLPTSYFLKPLMVVCHQCGVYDLFMPISCYNDKIIRAFINQVEKMYDLYMSKKDDMWWHYNYNNHIRDDKYFFLSEERQIKFMAKCYLRTIIFHDKQKEHFQLTRNIIQLVSIIINCENSVDFQDIIIDTCSAGEQYFTNRVNEVLGIGKRRLKRTIKSRWRDCGFEVGLKINRHTYHINLIYKRFGSFEPVTISFRKHFNKINLHFESYYNHGNVNSIINRIKKIEESIIQWNSLVTNEDLREFVATYRDERSLSEPGIMCQLLARKYFDINHVKDDMDDSRHLSLCLLFNDVLQDMDNSNFKN